MEKVKNILKPKPNPQQLLRDWQRRLRQECRNIERQIRDIQREEKSVQKAIKEAAKRNDMGSAKVHMKVGKKAEEDCWNQDKVQNTQLKYWKCI
ncbi:UNVERIFIED_CONTAM: Vacuolar protein sorting-associated protein [Sesamum angustifolium]|uniref:Vacuolar protein sorting-associated protein n=1 Tax=Sesamum angustifolium TaxID=2727405 RepID=A0AAW2QQ64_9LAMI